MSALANASDTHWDLSDLFASPEEAGRVLGELVVESATFAAAVNAGLTRETFPALVDELNRLLAVKQTLDTYLELAESADSRDPVALDLAASCQQPLTVAESNIRTFDLAWSALDEETALLLAGAPELDPQRDALLAQRRFAPYRMSAEREEVLLARDPLTDAWKSLHGRILSGISADVDGETLTLDELISCAHDPDPARRRAGLAAAYRALEPHADTLAACYDAVVADRLAEDRLRGYPDPLAQAHLDNQLEPEAVEQMLGTIQQHYPLAQRWFAAKAQALDVDTLELWDQYAPLGTPRSFSWPETSRLMIALYDAFHPLLGGTVAKIVEAKHVDVFPRPGKYGGAFCSPVRRGALPYVLLNHTDVLQDVMTSAHEFGHALHFELSLDQQTQLVSETGTALAEVPSTFGEFLCFDYLHANEQDPATRAALIFRVVEDAFPTVFRQAMMAAFEQRAYALRASGRALTAERLSEIWIEENERFYGTSVKLPAGYGLGWSYIPHFIHSRFYTYAYSFAHLVALALYASYQNDRQMFPHDYVSFLASGGCDTPANLLVPLGVDITSGALWKQSFQTFERMVDQAIALLSEPQWSVDA